MRRHVREILRQLKDIGIDSPIVTQNSHVKVRFHHNGRDRLLVMSTSPSDRNAIHNMRRDLQRLLSQ
jgi:hypothetical protein